VLRLTVALSNRGERGLQARDDFLAERTRFVQAMLDRAAGRGEHPPDVLDVLDHVMAPMYIRVLFGAGPLTPDYIAGLVDRLLEQT
ncbi:TetR-like C-terminal domain-containing protein, partial [Actinomadura violacea]